MKSYITIALLVYCIQLAGQQQAGFVNDSTLLFKDGFIDGLDTSDWIVETASAPGSRVYVKAGKLILDTKAGVTVWLNKFLEGNLLVSYKRKIILDNGPNDRISDLNQFWMATDPRNKNLFTRKGVFESYDSLSLYYTGMGGNTNTTTRLRKYEGNGEKTLIQEYTDSPHLLQANKEYNITTVIKDGTTQYFVDDVLFFTFTDRQPLRSGYFGFRSTKSRQEIYDVRIYRIK